MMEYYGYAGSILWINLATGKIEKEPLDVELAAKFVGSCGLQHVLASELIKPELDPWLLSQYDERRALGAQAFPP